MKSLHWNGLLARAKKGNWLPQVIVHSFLRKVFSCFTNFIMVFSKTKKFPIYPGNLYCCFCVAGVRSTLPLLHNATNLKFWWDHLHDLRKVLLRCTSWSHNDHVNHADRADPGKLLSWCSVMPSSPVRFPEISVCPASPYNMTRMASKGYSNPFYYYLGKDISTRTFIGWGGKDQEDPLELLENLTTIADNVVTDSKGTNWVDGTFYAYAYTSKPYKYLPAQIQVCT